MLTDIEIAQQTKLIPIDNLPMNTVFPTTSSFLTAETKPRLL